MRITGGDYRGRILESPKDRTIRPTSDKVRLAIFNILESRDLIRDAIVLDAFCGTGALGIEAVSRGASSCIFMDKNRESLGLCQRNYTGLKIPATSLFLLKDTTKIDQKPTEIPAANLIFLDPPYKKALVETALKSLEENKWLAPNAHILIETEAGYDTSPILQQGYEVLLERTYGDTHVALLGKYNQNHI